MLVFVNFFFFISGTNLNLKTKRSKNATFLLAAHILLIDLLFGQSQRSRSNSLMHTIYYLDLLHVSNSSIYTSQGVFPVEWPVQYFRHTKIGVWNASDILLSNSQTNYVFLSLFSDYLGFLKPCNTYQFYLFYN